MSSLEKTDPKVFDALNAGAFDFVDKPKENIADQLKNGTYPLLAMVKAAVISNTVSLGTQKVKRNNHHNHTFSQQLNYDIIAIGASTGGPGAIEAILKMLPANLSIPVVIAQHMPERFLESFALRLNNTTPLTVKLAQKGDLLQRGVIYIAPGHSNMKVGAHPGTGEPFISFTKRQFKEFNDPSVDCLFESIATTYGKKAIGVVLTGMGKDGTE
jgi:two-component system chemotaxis response regulator CheB